MKDIAILMPAWHVPELLKISVKSIIQSLTTNSELIVILNESDQESETILQEFNVKYISLKENYGTLAVDFAIPYIKKEKFKYICNINTDMIIQKGWDSEVIKIMEERSPCSVSMTLVEPNKEHPDPIRIYDDLGNFFDETIIDKFNQNITNKKYSTIEMRANSHPIVTTTDDYLKVGGYSNNMDPDWLKTKGLMLDPDFGYRLYKLHGNAFNFIRTNKIFVYHYNHYTRKKKSLMDSSIGVKTFIQKNNIDLTEYQRLTKINA
jgi:GT2 family glycosyltransferase